MPFDGDGEMKIILGINSEEIPVRIGGRWVRARGWKRIVRRYRPQRSLTEQRHCGKLFRGPGKQSYGCWQSSWWSAESRGGDMAVYWRLWKISVGNRWSVGNYNYICKLWWEQKASHGIGVKRIPLRNFQGFMGLLIVFPLTIKE